MSEFQKKYLIRCAIGVLVVLVLVMAFFAGGDEMSGVADPTPTPVPSQDAQIVFSETRGLIETPAPTPSPAATPVPTQNLDLTENTHIDIPKENVCTLSVRCDGLDKSKLPAEKHEFVPEDGVILDELQVNFSVGNSAYNVLEKILIQKKIHFETKNSLIGGVYISGINHLSEGDAGGQSGWGYMVNGEFPTVSAGEYKVKADDKIVWVYFQ